MASQLAKPGTSTMGLNSGSTYSTFAKSGKAFPSNSSRRWILILPLHSPFKKCCSNAARTEDILKSWKKLGIYTQLKNGWDRFSNEKIAELWISNNNAHSALMNRNLISQPIQNLEVCLAVLSCTIQKVHLQVSTFCF